MSEAGVDIAIIGGGLSGGLLALALAEKRPECRVLLLDSGARLGGNHVWSWFGPDVPASLGWLVDPLVSYKWRGYGVRFRRRRRQLPTSYRSITSERFDAVLRERLPEGAVRCGALVADFGPDHVTLAGGERIAARAVVDARGAPVLPGLVGGWQKFVGQRLKLAAPHGLMAPLVMDASKGQEDGFRFVYVLPFAPDEVFIEDTYYSTSPRIDREALVERIAAYARGQHWRVVEVLGEERGCLPVVAGGDPAGLFDAPQGVARIGTGAGLFHPLTGYSLPMAARMAAELAGLPDLSGEALAATASARARAHWRDGAYYRLLTRMAFGVAQPDQRYRVFERFYGLSPGLIERFYAGRSTWGDRLRILAGRPPVPVLAAIRCLLGGGLPLAPLGIVPPLDDTGANLHPLPIAEYEAL